MSSSYPPVPAALRQPLARIGIRAFRPVSANSIPEYSAAAILAWDDETNASGASFNASLMTSYPVALRFPAPFDLAGVYRAAWSNANYNEYDVLDYSQDSTNGWDGSWVRLSNAEFERDVTNTYRNEIESFTATMINWIKIKANGNANSNASARLRVFHIFGGWSTGINEDRLIAIDPVDDLLELDGQYLDLGDVVQGSTHERDFRVKNNSSTLTAEGVELGLFRQNSVMEYSIDGGATWSSSVGLGNLAPGAISPIVTVRRVVGATADLGLGVGVLAGEATSWVA